MRQLDEVIKQFLRQAPYGAERILQDGGRQHVIRWTQYTEPPASIGLIAGDAIHNLRSSLDHMVVALSKAGASKGSVSLTESDERALQFPIVLDTASFKKAIRGGRLKHVRPDAQAMIEARQPFEMVQGNPKDASIWKVAELDNADKHRQLPVAAIVPSIVQVGWAPEISRQFRARPIGTSPVPGVEIARYLFDRPRQMDDAPLEFRFGFSLLMAGLIPYHDIRFSIDRLIKSIRFTLDCLVDFLL